MSQAQPGSSWSSTFWSSSPVNLASAWQGMKLSWPGLHIWHKLDLCVDLSIYFKKKVFLSFLDLSPTCLKSHWTPLYCSSHSKVLCLTNNKNVQSGCVVRIDPTPGCWVCFFGSHINVPLEQQCSQHWSEFSNWVELRLPSSLHVPVKHCRENQRVTMVNVSCYSGGVP